MSKKKSAADIAKAVEKQARAKKSTPSETRKSKGGELDTRESKYQFKPYRP